MSDDTRLRELATRVAMMAPEPVGLVPGVAREPSRWMPAVVVAGLVAALLLPALFLFKGSGEVLTPASLGTLIPVEPGDTFQVVVPGADLPSVWRLDVVDGDAVTVSWGLFASGPIAWAPWSDVDLDALEPELRASPDNLELPDDMPLGVHRLCLPKSESDCFDLPVVGEIDRLVVTDGRVDVPDGGPVTVWSVRLTGVMVAEDVDLIGGAIDVTGMVGGTYFVCRLESAACWQFDVSTTEPDAPAAGRWAAIPESPLSARAWAIGAWTGTEVVVMGGEQDPWCPPGAYCTWPELTPMADGAAFDPRVGSWRAISPAPVPISATASHDVLAVGGDIYVLIAEQAGRSGTESAILRYRSGADEWAILPSPPADLSWLRLAFVHDSLLAYTGSDESGESPDWLFDPTTEEWSELSPDPLSPSYDRTMVEVDGALYLFAKDLVENPGSDEPSLVRAARYDPGSGAWTRLSDSEIIGGWTAWSAGGFIVFPEGGSADGGEVNNWGRSYPYGGVYDVESGVWLDVPAWPQSVAGAIVGDAAHYAGATGAVLDVTDLSWTLVPPHPGPAEVYGRLVIAAGTSMFTFGGEVWSTSGEVLSGGHLWSLAR